MRHLPATLLAELPYSKLKMSDCLQLEPLYKDTLACKESLGSGEFLTFLPSFRTLPYQPRTSPLMDQPLDSSSIRLGGPSVMLDSPLPTSQIHLHPSPLSPD